MAISYARTEFVKRSKGQNACAKAAYIARTIIYFEGTKFASAQIFDWSHKEPPLYNAILLPEGVDEKFRSMEYLWNIVEQFEDRSNSQVARDEVLGLPDDVVVSNEDRIQLALQYFQEERVDKGFAVQIAIHPPDEDNPNWHVHGLSVLRRFSEDGKTFESHKPRHLMPDVRFGKVVSIRPPSKKWANIQNVYFKTHGIDLQVDPDGVLSQIHVGPKRFRARNPGVMEEYEANEQLRAQAATDVKRVLNKLTEADTVFTSENAAQFFRKHVKEEFRAKVEKEFWAQTNIVQLMDAKTGEALDKFTTTEILEEEKEIFRFADRMAAKQAFLVKDPTIIETVSARLSNDQANVLEAIPKDDRLICINGKSGPGRIQFLVALKDLYERSGRKVRGLGPDTAVAWNLARAGIVHTDNICRANFFSDHYKKGFCESAEVWIVDVADGLERKYLKAFLKLACKKDVQVILAGDTSKSSMGTGRLFDTFVRRYGQFELSDNSIGLSKTERQNTCSRAAFNCSGTLNLQGNGLTDRVTYDWSKKEKPIWHEILLPEGVDEKYLSQEYLWNAVEKFEVDNEHQEIVDLALEFPESRQLSLEGKKEVMRSFVQEYFLSHRFGVQVDIYDQAAADSQNGAENRWRAHVLVTPRRFSKDGESFLKHNPQQTRPLQVDGQLVVGLDWADLGFHHNNQCFEASGMPIRIDPKGNVSLIQSNPIKFDVRVDQLFHEYPDKDRFEDLDIDVSSPKAILKSLTLRRNIFDKKDVEAFFQLLAGSADRRTIDATLISQDTFWMQEDIVQLLDPQKGTPLEKYTSKQVLEEEKKILRIADRLVKKAPYPLYHIDFVNTAIQRLNKEQKEAFTDIVLSQRMMCLHGLAGTGKSHVLSALNLVYENEGRTVRGLGPDANTVNVLKANGFKNASTIHHFLFSGYFNAHRECKTGEIWVVDEAAKLGSRPMLELLKLAQSKKAQIIFAGDTTQIPAIDRGRMFHEFLKRYSVPELKDIQRQKYHTERQISHLLGRSEVNEAFDLISKNGGFTWHATREGAMSDLIRQWEIDKELFPYGTSIIIAHRNVERKALSEMVRSSLKRRGELGEREFECQTEYGTIYVSEGDQIQFRKNDPEIRVRNGHLGTIVEASEDRFIVAIREENKTREVTFDPTKYNHFQLGYALTNYRSQGGTWDRAYVLHSKYFDKHGFFVGLTRHIRKVKMFVSRPEGRNLVHLKRQASTAPPIENTVNFLTQGEFQNRRYLEETQRLKASSDLGEKATGYFREALSGLQSGITSIWHRFRDPVPDQEFFHPKIKKPLPGSVKEVDSDSISQERLVKDGVPRIIGPQDFDVNYRSSATNEKARFDAQKYILSERIASLENVQVGDRSLKQMEQPWNDIQRGDSPSSRSLDQADDIVRTEPIRSTSGPQGRDGASGSEIKYEASSQQSADPKISDKFSDPEGVLLDKYRSAAEDASALNGIVSAEADSHGKDKKLTSRYQDWQKSCGKRNEAAYHLQKAFSEAKLMDCLGKNSLVYLKQQASKHEAMIVNRGTVQELEHGLRDSMEPLLYRLFPEGPSKRTKREFRYGNNGSLVVTVEGEKAGSYYDFEKAEGGSMLRLIANVQSLSREHSVNWAKEFLAGTKFVPRSYDAQVREPVQENVWTSLQPPEGKLAPSLSDVGAAIAKRNNEIARHPYKDENGKLLFYTVRLVDKETKKKVVLPLSYGYFKGNEDSPRWNLKAYQMDSRPLYNLDQLHARKGATVLVVEGEKTADAARHMYPDMVVVTWMGGSSAVSKTDWGALFLRDIIIWPDNDSAGHKACNDIVQHLRQVGVRSLRVVDRRALEQDFPQKWDLADPLPEGKSRQHIDDLIAGASERAVGLTELLSSVSGSDNPKPVDILLAREVLWRVEYRMRPQLEAEFGNRTWEIRAQILQEAERIILGKEEIADKIETGLQCGNVVSEQLGVAHLLFQARRGVEPSIGQMDELRKSVPVAELNQIFARSDQTLPVDKEVHRFIVGKHLGDCLENGNLSRQTKQALGLVQEASLVIKQLSTQIDINRVATCPEKSLERGL